MNIIKDEEVLAKFKEEINSLATDEFIEKVAKIITKNYV